MKITIRSAQNTHKRLADIVTGECFRTVDGALFLRTVKGAVCLDAKDARKLEYYQSALFSTGANYRVVQAELVVEL